MKRIPSIAAALLFAFLAAGVSAQEKVVYQFDAGPEQATAGLRNLYNHLEVDPCGGLEQRHPTTENRDLPSGAPPFHKTSNAGRHQASPDGKPLRNRPSRHDQEPTLLND